MKGASSATQVILSLIVRGFVVRGLTFGALWNA